MLYLISGASRSGKTTIAKNIFHRNNLPYMSLDWLVMGFTNGEPGFGIHDKLWPNEIAGKIWSFFKAMIDGMLWEDVDYVIEGEAILPALVVDLIKKHPDRIKIVFVGYTDIAVSEKVALVKKYSGGDNDWLTKEPDHYINDHISNMVEYSKKIKGECDEVGLPYFDTSDDFLAATDRATTYLTGESNG